MRNELKVEFWKAKGVPHLTLFHQKTGMTEALTKYDQARKKKLDPDGAKARQDAMQNLKNKLDKLKREYTQQRHPKLWADYITKADPALRNDIKEYNDAITKFGEVLLRSPNIQQYKAAMSMMISGFAIGSAFWELAQKEFSTENLAFLGAMAISKDPQWIYNTFVPANAPQAINIAGAMREQVRTALAAAQSNADRVAALMPAFHEIVELLYRDTYAQRFRTFKLRVT
jgi:hypothetical protein